MCASTVCKMFFGLACSLEETKLREPEGKEMIDGNK